jgi:phosphoribosylformylglycinamidine cyclo-ligase
MAKTSSSSIARSPQKKKAYAAAGVDVDLGNRVKSGIQALVKGTHGPEVLGRIGGFGGLFRPNFRGMKDPVLVSSVDGVGTKLKIAFAAEKHDTVGQDLVNHCINDIAVIGAKPLFFLDYIGAERLEPGVFRAILKGFAKACKTGGWSEVRPHRCRECISAVNMTSLEPSLALWIVQRFWTEGKFALVT